MKLYLIVAMTVDGENNDLFVRAETPAAAVKYLLKYYETIRADYESGDCGIWLFEVPPHAGRAGAVAWNTIPVTEAP